MNNQNSIVSNKHNFPIHSPNKINIVPVKGSVCHIHTDLKTLHRLLLLSKLGLGEANKNNPFISKKEAMEDINRIRKLIKNYGS